MAPTICSDKTKQQNLRANHKELRRLRQISRNSSYANATSQTSNIISYVSSGSNNMFTSGLRFRSDQSNTDSSEERLIDSQQNRNIGKTHPANIKNAISLQHSRHQSTLISEVPSFRRSLTPLSDISSLQYTDDDMVDENGQEQRVFPYDSKPMKYDDDNSSIFSSVISSDMHSSDESSYKQTVLKTPIESNEIHKNLQANNSKTIKQEEDSTEYRNGLLSIALKTIKLVQRNQLLQQRLSQLQMETSEFIESVMSNPENQHFRQKIQQTQQQQS